MEIRSAKSRNLLLSPFLKLPFFFFFLSSLFSFLSFPPIMLFSRSCYSSCSLLLALTLVCVLSFVFLNLSPFLLSVFLPFSLRWSPVSASFFLPSCLSSRVSVFLCSILLSRSLSLSLSLFLVSFHPLLRIPFLSDVLPWRGDGPCNPRVRPLQQRNAKETKHRKTKQPRNKLTVWNCSQRAQDTRTCRATAKHTKVTAAATTAWSSQRPHKSLSCPVEPRQVLVRTPSKAASAIRLLIPTPRGFASHPAQTHFC